jgi:lipoate-protein ligase A
MWIDDDVFERCREPLAFACYVPRGCAVVLGSANEAAREADLDACAAGGVPILRRAGGGGAVVLHEGCVVVSLGAWVRHPYQNKTYFELLNNALIEALAGRWPTLARLNQRGISDVVDGQRKVAGTSLFRSRHYLLYQASLLVEARLGEITRYLRHPSREPDYRSGRQHADFITDVSAVVGEPLAPAQVAAHLEDALPGVTRRLLADELIDADVAHVPTILVRAARGRAESDTVAPRPPPGAP